MAKLLLQRGADAQLAAVEWATPMAWAVGKGEWGDGGGDITDNYKYTKHTIQAQ